MNNTEDLSNKIIDNSHDPYGFRKALDEAYNVGIDHALNIVNGQQIRWAETYFTPEAVLKEIVEKLTKLKK